MLLKVKDRIRLPLPEKTCMLDGIICRDIVKKTEITQDDMAKYEIITEAETGKVSWNAKKDIGTEIEFTDAELRVICNQIDKLDKESSILSTDIPLYLLFQDEQKAQKDSGSKTKE